MTDNSPEEAAFKRGASILGYHALGKEELFIRLVEKGEPEEAARHAVDRLESLRFLNDEEYGKEVRDSLRRKGYGARRVLAELAKRKLDRQLTEELMAEFEPDWETAIHFLTGKLGETPDRGQVKKAFDGLMRRGFSWEEAGQALRFWEESRQTEDKEGGLWL